MAAGVLVLVAEGLEEVCEAPQGGAVADPHFSDETSFLLDDHQRGIVTAAAAGGDRLEGGEGDRAGVPVGARDVAAHVFVAVVAAIRNSDELPAVHLPSDRKAFEFRVESGLDARILELLVDLFAGPELELPVALAFFSAQFSEHRLPTSNGL